jgi:hypothetical protein
MSYFTQVWNFPATIFTGGENPGRGWPNFKLLGGSLFGRMGSLGKFTLLFLDGGGG